MEPLVSIIIPVFNAENYLEETLSSISALQYPNVEVILVNDGSTDNSVHIANEYVAKNNHARLIHQPNQGVSVARNTGIAQAKGKYILPFDSDDIINENYVGEAVLVLENNEDVKVVCSKAEYFGDKTGSWDLPEFSLFALAHRNLLPVCCMYRKADWEKVGGYCTDLPGREDWDFWISLLKNGGNVVKLPLVGFKYRMHKTSKRNRTRKLKRYIFEVLNKRHPDFFKKQINGPLRIHRQLSKPYNTFLSLLGILK